MKQIICAFIILFSFNSFSFFDISYEDFILKESKNGTEIYTNKDGSVITKTDLYEECISADKKRTINRKNGETEIFFPDGRKIEVNKKTAQIKYILPNGKVQTMSLLGKTPYGNEIRNVSQVLQKEPLIKVNYVAAKSDEVFENAIINEKGTLGKDGIKSFFDEIASSLKGNLLKDKYDGGSSFSIDISFIKYAQFGYAYQKEKNVTVEFIKDNKVIKVYSFFWMDIRSSEKRIKHVSKVTDIFIGLRK